MLSFPLSAIAQTWQITPSIGLRGTLTDNVNLSPPDLAKSDFITEVIPGIQISGQSPRLKLFLNYSLDMIFYAKTGSQNNNNQSSLNATLNYEAIDNFMFVDARANISQQALLPFGPTPTVGALATDNRTQTQSYLVSPYIRGPLVGEAARYELRYTAVWNTTAADAIGNSYVGTTDGFVRGNTGIQNLGWGIAGYVQNSTFKQGRDTTATRLNGDLNYTFNPEFRINAVAGRERNNYTTLEQTTYDNYGGGFEWNPTERTRIYGFQERRFFGNGWKYGFTQRSPFFTFAITSTQDVTTNGQDQLAGTGGTAYDLLFASLTTRIPDPVLRATEARRLLQQAGLPADLFLPNGFAYNQQVLQQSNSASVIFNGVRNTLAFSINQTKQQPLAVGVQDPSNFSSPSAILQTYTNSAWSYALTAFTSFSLTGNYIRTRSGDGSQASDQWTGNAILTTQLGARTSASLGARYVRFETEDAGINDYREKAVFGYLSYRF